ncbi:MAG TPA: PAS domain S-box protein [Steroidobacteraceae bacterium]|nr:PAS domain S-box protein [Steroidobacteraceae bacterium]
MNPIGQAERRTLLKWAKVSGFTLLLAFAGLIISAIVSARQDQLVRVAIGHRAEIDQYAAQLQTVLVSLVDAETGQRGYLLTGKSSYLAPYQQAVAAIPRVLEGLRTEPFVDPALAAETVQIRQLAAGKLAELAETIRLHERGEDRASEALVRSGLGEQTMQRFRQAIAESMLLLRQERGALDAKVIRGTVRTQRLELLTLAAMLLCALFAALQAGSLWLAYVRYDQALSASERQHRAIVEHQTELISLAALDGSLEFINPAYGRFFGIPVEALAGRSIYDLLSATERVDWAEQLARLRKPDEALLREQFVAATGAHSPRWIEWRHRAQHAADGVRIHSVGRDITLRKKAEDGLRAREDFLLRIGRVAGVGGWSMDLSNQQLFWSAEVRKIHEVSDDYVPVLARSLDCFPPQARAKLSVAIDDAIEQHTQWDLELPFRTLTGRKIWVRTVGEAELDSHGNAIRLVGALQDITQRKATERSLRELTEVFDNTPDFIAQADWQGQVHYLNPAAREALGMSRDAPLTGHLYSEFYTPETNERFLHEIIPAVKQQGVWVGESQVVLEGGRIVPVSHMVIAHLDAVGRVSRYTSLMRDISSELTNRQELAKKTSTLNSIVEAIPAMLAVWDGAARYQLVNRAFERWRGRGRDAFLGRTIEEAVGPDEFASTLPWIERALAGETVVYEKEFPNVRDCRHVSVTYTPLRREDGAVDGFIGLAQDITDQRDERRRLVRLSEHDPLTGLLNRAGFESYLIEKVSRGEGSGLAVLYIDLDHFKPVNDRYGHATGDELLREFGLRLKAAVRPSDAVARVGGDEFGIVLAGVRESSHAAKVADKVIGAAIVPFEVGGVSLTIGASVGVAYNGELEGGWKGLLARADAKVYEAKAAGRGRRVVADFEPATAQMSEARSAS